MFWNYEEWTNAFLIQLFAIVITFVVGRKNQVKNEDIFVAVSLVCPVALFNISAGVAGAIFLSDFVAFYLLYRKNNSIKRSTIIFLAFVLYLVWPVLSSLFSIVYEQFATQIIDFDTKVLMIQFSRYFLYFILFAKLVSKPYNTSYLIRLFKIQSVMIFFIFTAILVGYIGLIKVDAWNEVIKKEQDGLLGKGGMFLYRAGIGAFGTISVPLIFYCYVNGKALYKYLMMFLILIILLTVLLSGSRQGITFCMLSLFVSIVLFKQYSKGIQILILGIVLFLLALQNDSFNETSEWFFKRYDILLNKNIDLRSEIGDRNTALDAAKNQVKDFFYEINGFGLGGRIIPTESDYYNTYSYFGIIGSAAYYIFIFYCVFRIYFNWKVIADKSLKNIFAVSLVVCLVSPLCGFQQWYIMTFSSHSAMNTYLILFLISFALSNTKILDNKSYA